MCCIHQLNPQPLADIELRSHFSSRTRSVSRSDQTRASMRRTPPGIVPTTLPPRIVVRWGSEVAAVKHVADIPNGAALAVDAEDKEPSFPPRFLSRAGWTTGAGNASCKRS